MTTLLSNSIYAILSFSLNRLNYVANTQERDYKVLRVSSTMIILYVTRPFETSSIWHRNSNNIQGESLLCDRIRVGFVGAICVSREGCDDGLPLTSGC